MSAPPRTADDLARLSRLVLTFDGDLWETILSWPVSLEDAARVPAIGQRTMLPAYDVDDVLQEVARLSNLVCVCKTFYNRYRIRNKNNWLEYVLVRFDETNQTGVHKEIDWNKRAVVCKPMHRKHLTTFADQICIVIRGVHIHREENVMVDAIGWRSADDDRVRHRQFVQRDVRLGFDLVPDFDLEGAAALWADPAAAERAKPMMQFVEEIFPLAEVRILHAEVNQSMASRSGYGIDLGRVPSLPDGPLQHRTMVWTPSETRVELDVKVSGGTVRFRGVCNNTSFKFNHRARLVEMEAAARLGTAIPLRTRRGEVWWRSIEFQRDPIGAELPNVRTFMPPVAKAAAAAQPQRPKQGRPPEPNLDAEEDDD